MASVASSMPGPPPHRTPGYSWQRRMCSIGLRQVCRLGRCRHLSLVTCHSKRECSISQAAGAGRILVLHYSSQYSAQHTNGREIVFCSGAPHALTMRYRFEDFAECFPTYVEEDRNGASATFNSIADYIEAQNFVRSVHIYFNASQA